MATNFEFMNLPLQINPTFAGPLERGVVFSTRSDADNWLLSAYAYEGALVRIKEDNKWKLYITQNDNGILVFEKYKSGSGYPYDEVFKNIDELVPNVDSADIIDKVNEMISAMNSKTPADSIQYLGAVGGIDQVTMEDIYNKINEMIRKLKGSSDDE